MLLKDYYSREFYKNATQIFKEIIPKFSDKKFTTEIFTKEFESMELKERMRHTTIVLHKFFPGDFKAAATILIDISKRLKETTLNSFPFLFLPDYVQFYGIEDFEASIAAMEEITQYISCEFAVRLFLIKYEKPMMAQMLKWAAHKSYHVRRLASEGCRPRLPWGLGVPALKKDPTAVIKVLNKLKKDPSEWVRKSVANNLNDIAKDHPDKALALVKEWHGISKETDAIIKHGSRTLLKQGHTEILAHYGLDARHVQIKKFALKENTIKVGDHLEFSFNLTNLLGESQLIRLEYAIYYRMKQGQLSKKVFKISEKNYPAKEEIVITKRHRFVKITTRVYYSGEHKLSVIANGEEKSVISFLVADSK